MFVFKQLDGNLRYNVSKISRRQRGSRDIDAGAVGG